MKKFMLKASAAAIAIATAPASMAVVTLDDGVNDTVTYAQELFLLNTTAITGTQADVQSDLGFGVSTGQTRYLRYDLSNGVFDTAAAPADLTIGGAGAAVTVASGGNVGDDFIIFQITASGDLADDVTAEFTLGSGPGIDGLDRNQNVTVTYELYEDAPSAANQLASGLLATASEAIASFGPGVALSVTTNRTTTASVTDVDGPYFGFDSTTGGSDATGDNAAIGRVDFDVTTAVKPDGTATAMTDFVAAGTKLVVRATDLSAFNNTFADATPGAPFCNNADVADSNLTATSVDIVTDTNAVDHDFCVTTSGTSAIAEQDMTVEASVVPAANTDTASIGAIPLGSIDRDGTVLKAPYVAGIAAQATFINLANMGTLDAPFSTRCLTASGAPTAGTGGTVPAGNTLRQDYGSLGCAPGTRSVELTFAVPTGNVIGSVVRMNRNTGDSAMDGMVGNQ